MAFLDKLKNAATKAVNTARTAVETAVAEQEERRKAEQERLKAEMEAAAQKRKEDLEKRIERIVNGDPNHERWNFLEDATPEEIAQLNAREKQKAQADREARLKARAESGYAQKLLTESDSCNFMEPSPWYCTTYADYFYANCGGGVLCDRKQRHKEAGTYDELLFPDSWEYLARLSALEEGGPAKKLDRTSDVIREFCEAYLPACVDQPIDECILKFGLGKKNYRLEFLRRMGERPELLEDGYFKQFLVALKEPPVDKAAADAYYDSMIKLLKNPSLYRKTYNYDPEDDTTTLSYYYEFRYLIHIFSITYNPELLTEYYDYPQVVKPEELFTDDGQIKAAGIVEKDPDNFDSIYGVVEYWGTKSKKLAARNGQE